MGTDKAHLLLAGQTFVQRIAAAMSQAASTVTLVGRDAANFQTSLPCVADVYGQWGALGGVHAALAACQSPWALVVACDLPFVTGPLLTRLAGLRQDFAAVAPIQNDDRPQPLCALYRVNPCLEKANELIKSRERRPVALLQSVRTRWVTFGELADLDSADRFFDNINTPQDFARANEEGVS